MPAAFIIVVFDMRSHIAPSKTPLGRWVWALTAIPPCGELYNVGTTLTLLYYNTAGSPVKATPLRCHKWAGGSLLHGLTL